MIKHEFFQACYAHPDTGWAVLNTSADIPQALAADFSAVGRVSAGMSAGKKVPMGENETPACMMEIYCRNDTAGLVRTQYSLSDGQGRPISFSHGYLFPGAYDLLKNPDELLRIRRENFADQRISEEKNAELHQVPGAFNRELIRVSEPNEMPEELLSGETYSYKGALEACHLSESAYCIYILALYAHILSANAEKNLYIKTDGSEKYAWNLLYLTYLALPYSMRPLLSAATYLHAGQHNAKLIFCYELPDGVPQITPVTGENNVMNEIVEKRIRERNPFITAGLDYIARGKQDYFFDTMEACLRLMGDEKLNSMTVMNLAYSICKKEYNIPERLPVLLYQWLALQVRNTDSWENAACILLNKAEENAAAPAEEVKKLLKSRIDGAVTEKFKLKASQYLELFSEGE